MYRICVGRMRENEEVQVWGQEEKGKKQLVTQNPRRWQAEFLSFDSLREVRRALPAALSLSRDSKTAV
jgi:predicted Fe-S protein YdhL (DUF1289 family)